jgi:virginiamycin B lyase
MVLGPDGNVWFTDYGNDNVGKITTAGTITTYSTTPLGAQPSGIAKGPDNNLWVADAYGSIIKVTTAGAMTQYKTGLTAGGAPQYITAAPDGNLYFTEAFFSSSKSDHVGRITTSGAINEFGTLAANTYPNVITTGADGNVYFTEYGATNLGKITLATQAVTEYPLGLMDGSAIVNGPDNNLWVGQRQTIAKISY